GKHARPPGLPGKENPRVPTGRPAWAGARAARGFSDRGEGNEADQPPRRCGVEKVRVFFWAAMMDEISLAGRRILVTAGPTWVRIDSVRHIGNMSSGRTGLLIARTAAARGATATLLMG